MLEGLVAGLLNRFIGPYVTNLNVSQLNIAIWSGDVKLTNLRLKKDALDKFNLPVDVVEGYLGELTLSIPWSNLKNKPVKVYINNVYLLCVPKGESDYDADEEAARAQALKEDRLANAELLSTKPAAGMDGRTEKKNATFLNQLVTKVVDNLQVSINNIHVRYEDKMSDPKHPFSAGLTLSQLSAVSTDGDWVPTFIHDEANTIHKLATLDSLAMYWNTDSRSLAGRDKDDALKTFMELVAKAEYIPKEHQYILKPVSGTGKVKLNKRYGGDVPKTGVSLNFDELGFVVDDEQYNNVLLMMGLFHSFMRQHEFRKFRPPKSVTPSQNPLAWFRYAGNAVLSQIHERNRKWTWAYFEERRDDRKAYVELYKNHKLGRNDVEDEERLKALEWKLSYDDIRLYRSIAKGVLRREKILIEKKQVAEQPKGWLSSWWYGSNSKKTQKSEEEEDATTLTDEQKQQLYDVIDYDEKAALQANLEEAKDTILYSIDARLRTGSFALKNDPHGANKIIFNVVFDTFLANFLTRTDNFVAGIALGGLTCIDGTTQNTLYPKIVRVKEAESKKNVLSKVSDGDTIFGGESSQSGQAQAEVEFNPFFSVNFEQNPLDNHADSVLEVKMRHLEILYNPKTVDTVMEFLKPPPSEADSINALLEAAGDTLEGLAAQTRAGLEYALEEHKRLDLRVDMDAPVMIFPESCTDINALVAVLDVGHIFVESNLVSKEDMAVVENNHKRTMTGADMEKLEELMYDRFVVQLSSTQLLVGQSVERCLQQIRKPDKGNDLHVIDKINMTFHVHLSILPQAPNLTKIKVFGDLPLLQINFSDRKYKTLMRIVDLVVPKDDENPAPPPPPKRKSSMNIPLLGKSAYRDDLVLGDTTEGETDDERVVTRRGKTSEDKEQSQAMLLQKTFQFSFKVTKFAVTLKKAPQDVNAPERVLADLIIERFKLEFALRPVDMAVDIVLGSLYVEDKVDTNPLYPYLISSDDAGKSPATEGSDLVHVSYIKVNPISPDYLTKYKGIDATVDISFSTVTMILTRKSVLTLFDYVLTTFTGPAQNQAPATAAAGDQSAIKAPQSDSDNKTQPQDTMKVKVKMTSINFILNNDGQRLATMALSQCDVAVMMKSPTMRVNVKLGNFTLVDDINPGKQQILAIQGEELADFAYETFNPESSSYPGYDASVFLRAGSLQLTFLEEPIRELLDFSTKFARMHVLYDSARNAAVNQAQALQTTASKFHFDVQICTPIVILPKDAKSRNTIVANLGEISIRNEFADDAHIEGGFLDQMKLEIHSINLISQFYFNDTVQELQIIEDVDIDVDVIRANHKDGLSRPDMELIGRMSDVSMNLTELQYKTLYGISMSVARAFGGGGNVDTDALAASAGIPSAPPPPPAPKAKDDKWTSIDLVFSMPQVALEIYQGDATQKEFRECSFSKFSLSKTDFKYKMMTDSTMNAELTIQDLIINDTRRDVKTRFREVIPANLHDSPQISMSLSTFDDNSMLVLLNIDSPKVIFHLEYIFALQSYFMSALNATTEAEVSSNDRKPSSSNQVSRRTSSSTNPKGRRSSNAVPIKPPEPAMPGEQSSSLHYRLSVVSPEIILLANAASSATDAIILSAHQVVISQQETMTLIVDRVGMFLCKMDKRDDTSLRFIDNFDIALSMGSRSPTPGHQLTSITLDVRPLVLRLSYRDAMLIMDIVNKATELQSKAQPSTTERALTPPKQEANAGPAPRAIADADRRAIVTSVGMNSPKPNAKRLIEEASFVSTRETLKGVIQGVQLILIDDMYSLPILDLKLDRFDVEVKEWSSEMKVDTSLRTSINYFNVRNSHWEPLLEPWQFVIHVSKVVQPPNMLIDIFSKQDLNINITHTFIETALQIMTTIQEEPEQITSINRETLVPYLLKNRTGYPLHVWAESENNTDIVVHKIKDGANLPWRFDDWRKMRETVASKKNTLGIQFDGVPWESLKDVPVEREGRYLYVLRPKLSSVSHRIAIDIHIKNNVKVVTFSSALLVENATSLPIEVVIVDEKKKHLSSAKKIAPGEDFSVPIEAAYKNRLLVRPDPGFNYNWSSEPIFWRELVAQQHKQEKYKVDGEAVGSVSCRPLDDPNQQSFRFQVRGVTDNFDPLNKDYPYMTIRLSAPVEIENLLPYNLRYTVMEKTSPKHSGTVLSSYLRKGGISPLHTVDVRNLMLLSIAIENTTFGASEYAIVSSHDPSELPVENTLTLTDPDGLKLMLGIHRHVIPGSGGAVKFSIYCPYVILNKTGLDLVFKAKSFMQNAKIAAGQGGSRIVQNKALPLMFSYGKAENGNRVLLQVEGNTQWSRPVSFEAVGSIMEIAVQAMDRKEEIHLGMNVELGKGKYALTKVVTITPRFILKNNLNEDLNFREYGSNNVTLLPAQQRVPLRYLRLGQEKLLSLRLPGVTSRWTAPFNIDEMGKMHVTILRSDGEIELIRVHVMMEVATVFVVLNKEEGRWPYRIDNRSSWDISFRQHSPVRNESASASSASFASSTAKTYKLKAGETMAYSWDLPFMKEKALVLTVNGREREVSLQEIGSLVPFKFPAGDANSIISIDVIAEGPTQVLVLADYDSKQSMFKQRSSSQLTLVEREDADRDFSNKDLNKEGFEVIDVDAVVTFSFQVRLECIGISILNQRMQELMYLSMTGLEMRYTDSNMYQSINMMVKWLQIDNQLYGGSSPIILCPTQTPKDGKDASAHPTLHSALVRAKDETHGVVYFKYFSALLQELTVAMDEDFLYTLLEFSKFNVPGWTADPNKVQLCDESLDLPEPAANDDENQLFFEVLHLHPMKVNLSFMRSDRVNIEEAQQKTSSHNPIMYIFNVLTMAIGNIDAAPITLNALLLENVRASGPVLVDLLQRHYSQDFFYQLHMIVGSIEFLGNPVGLFNNLSSGVADFFYEPYQGFIMGDRPQDFGLGIARGTSSLLKKTVFGFSDSLAKISGSVGKGLSAATMDKTFQERRRMGNQRNAPKHALSGLSQGASSLAQGLVSGVTGIVEQPLTGAQNGGVEGFFKGVGKGLVGAVTKPLVGVFDFTTNVTSGIRNTTTVFDKDQRRKRIPRHVPKNGILTLYDKSEALGQYWLKQVDSGRYFYDDYIAHLVLKGDNMIAMLTSKRIMVFRAESLKVEWELEFSEIQSIAPFPRGIAITSRRGGQENFIPIFEQTALQWFSGKIEEKVNQFNADLKPLE
ncbi:hypothetical protein BCR41DRAFT_313859 [Lobosporangium transversale]|uniref:Vacuolar protein sorting-associated protein n=1 Tax=Lobosporangium transversale TaxID=64571 RepID=A0A1Y2G7M3_9FUNG|nr:hypothetical protein BCR41DRAFT_313859 [Lobosporangium transversale]ORZ00047.1 hypothetical protein BCR41DRAFT_313859 [Lobosporangium transversale]|eukprot:XP_021876088.1 hypothetical protein BCR41DRAFT_313859 [Lobosporangium transversale]